MLILTVTHSQFEVNFRLSYSKIATFYSKKYKNARSAEQDWLQISR